MTESISCQIDSPALRLAIGAVAVPDAMRSPGVCVSGHGLLGGQFARPGGQKIALKSEPRDHEPAAVTWTSERVELLKTHFDAGLSCAQIARRIGVTRNAVIGKLTRLGLSRPRSETAKKPARIAAATPRRQPSVRSKLTKSFRAEARIPIVEAPLATDQQCSLLELTALKCRWPIGDPGTETFCFCGNEQIEGFSYCAAHARMAYRRATYVRRPVRCQGQISRPEISWNGRREGVNRLAMESVYPPVP